MTYLDPTARSILAAYCALHDTALSHPSRADRRIADTLVARAIPLDIVCAALFLATERRRLSSPTTPPHIRSLAYFLPVIDELLNADPGYVTYLASRLHGPKNSGSR